MPLHVGMKKIYSESPYLYADPLQSRAQSLSILLKNIRLKKNQTLVLSLPDLSIPGCGVSLGACHERWSWPIMDSSLVKPEPE